MKQVIRAVGAGMLALGILGRRALRGRDKVKLGVAIPTADHGFTGGIVWWANKAKKELEKAHPDLKVIVKTAASAPEQANQLQDLVTVNKINALVIFPFESASLTKPVAQVKNKGVYVTVVDRGLTDTSAQDAYVAGDNTAFGKIPAEYLAKALDGKGDIVALRGIPTTLDNERMDAFTRRDEELSRHQDARRQVRQLEPRRRVQGDAGLPDALQAHRRGLGRRRRHGGRRAQGDRPGQAHRHQDRVRRRRREGHGQDVMDGAPLIKADVSYSPKFIYDAIKLTAEARLKGEKLPATTIIPSVLITKENAQAVLLPGLAVLTRCVRRALRACHVS